MASSPRSSSTATGCTRAGRRRTEYVAPDGTVLHDGAEAWRHYLQDDLTAGVKSGPPTPQSPASPASPSVGDVAAALGVTGLPALYTHVSGYSPFRPARPPSPGA